MSYVERRNFKRQQSEQVYEEQRHGCAKCGKNIPLYAMIKHHKNGNRSDNSTINLELLCGNCHDHPHGKQDIRRLDEMHRVTFYIPQDTAKQLNNYMGQRIISGEPSYGLLSRTITNALNYYYSNSTSSNTYTVTTDGDENHDLCEEKPEG